MTFSDIKIWFAGKKIVILNLATAAVTYADLLPIKYSIWVLIAGNIVLRLFSTGPETLLKDLAGFLNKKS